MAILTELKDPRIRDVTVTYVEVSGDLRHAKVHVSVMGDDTQQQLSLRGLQSAAGFLQSKCSDRLALRYTPRIQFLLDQGVKKSIEISRILSEVLPPEPSEEPLEEPAEEPGGGPDRAGADLSEVDSGAAAQGPFESNHPPPPAE